jgi:hypothetical protein
LGDLLPEQFAKPLAHSPDRRNPATPPGNPPPSGKHPVIVGPSVPLALLAWRDHAHHGGNAPRRSSGRTESVPDPDWREIRSSSGETGQRIPERDLPPPHASDPFFG